MKPFLRQLAAVTTLAVAAFTTACSSDSSSGPVTTPTGSLAMSTARGMSVPHTFTDAAGSKLTIEGGSIVLSSGGTYELHYKGKLNALTFDLTDEGMYKLAGTTVTFTPDDGDPAFTGRIAGTTVSVDDFKIAGAKFDLGFAK
jgi:ABC-type Fe3+-hydroxamate transport system substrate-binding protein